MIVKTIGVKMITEKIREVKTIVWVTYGSGLLLNAMLWIIALLFFSHASSSTVLHYSYGVGIDMVGQGITILVLPAVGLAICLLNLMLGVSLRHISSRAWWLLSLTAPLVQASLFVALMLLWRVNR